MDALQAFWDSAKEKAAILLGEGVDTLAKTLNIQIKEAEEGSSIKSFWDKVIGTFLKSDTGTAITNVAAKATINEKITSLLSAPLFWVAAILVVVVVMSRRK